MSLSAAAVYAAANNSNNGKMRPNALQPVAVSNIRTSFGGVGVGAAISDTVMQNATNSATSDADKVMEEDANITNGANGGTNGNYTTTAMNRWSLLDRKLPAADSVKTLHIYDFDNTLFKTPTPNPKLWNTPAIGTLMNQDVFVNGGWWHDSRILAATGEGLAKEEPRAWEGWWNEQVVDLVRLTGKQEDALSVLLTGRSETGFGDLIKRIAASKGLDFDMVVLKPAAGPNNEKFSSTMAFKQTFLETLMETYAGAEQICIYEDRPRHVQGFREFLAKYNRQQREASGRPTIAGQVVHVADMASNLDPIVEAAEVQHMINCHNAIGGGKRGRLALNKTVFFTGYLLKEADSQRLLSLLNGGNNGTTIPAHLTKRDNVRYHANSVLICPRVCPPHILSKTGGMGSKMLWEVVATGSIDNSVWAVSVRPVPSTAKYYVEGQNPIVVLAVARSAKPHEAGRIRKWHPVPRDKAFVFETTVGEKALLRVESENENGSRQQQYSGPTKRKHTGPHYNGPGGGGGGGGNYPKGPIPTQPAAFGAVPPAAPRQPSGSSYGQQGRGGFHTQAGRGRGNGGGGNFRGQGFNGNRGRGGGGVSMRGRGGGAVGGNVAMVPPLPPAPGAPGAPTGPGRGQQQAHRHYYQSLDDAGGTGSSSQPMMYDD